MTVSRNLGETNCAESPTDRGPFAPPTLGDQYRTLAAVLATARREAGLSQRLLAQRLGKAHSHVSLIETGQRRVEALELYRMAKAFGIPPAALFEIMTKRLELMEPGNPGAWSRKEVVRVDHED